MARLACIGVVRWCFVALCVDGHAAFASSSSIDDTLRAGDRAARIATHGLAIEEKGDRTRRSTVGTSARESSTPSRTCFELELTDSLGDGWNGARYQISDIPGGHILETGTMDDGFC